MQGDDYDGSMVNGVLSEEGTHGTLGITAAVTVKPAAGRLFRISVVVAGSGTGTVNDCASTGAAATANQFGTIQTTVGTYVFNWPCATGITVVPGSGQTLAASWA